MSKRLKEAFDTERKLLSIYFTAGYPNIDDTRSIIRELQDSGAHMIEIGLPFSDPLADGPTVQTATYTALTQGTTVADCIAMIRELFSDRMFPLTLGGIEAGTRELTRRH